MLIEFIFICAALGAACYFLHWCMGSPSGGSGTERGVSHGGRIFSAYGDMLIERHDKHEIAEAERIARLTAPYMRAMHGRAHFVEFREKTARLHVGTMSDKEVQDYNELSERVAMDEFQLKERMKRRKRITFTKAAGACLVCFSFWFAVFTLAFCVACGLLALNLWLIFAPALVSFFTQVTRIIYNT